MNKFETYDKGSGFHPSDWDNATRVGSFDHEFYNRIKYGSKSYIREAFEEHKDEFKEVISRSMAKNK